MSSFERRYLYKIVLFSLVSYLENLSAPDKILSGDEAIGALYEYVEELNGEYGGELPENKRVALTKLAKCLILCIEAEEQVCNKVKKPHVLIQLVKAIENHITKSPEEKTEEGEHIQIFHPIPTPQRQL
jgi:hypothetical protein